MPYINEAARAAVDELEDFEGLGLQLNQAGDLNYAITKLVKGFLAWPSVQPNYEEYNRAIGVLESVKLELYRRMVAPYEDTKIVQNGDVY